jgi:hypothetical protein
MNMLETRTKVSSALAASRNAEFAKQRLLEKVSIEYYGIKFCRVIAVGQ